MFQIRNPRKIKFWYNIYKKNHQLKEGNSTSLNYSNRVSTKDKYFVSLQYIWAGKTVNEEFDIPFIDKQLNIKSVHPRVVYPGEKAKILVQATDVNGSPAKNVDITAYAFTKKFKNTNKPDLPYFGRLYKSRKSKNTFSKEEFEDFSDQKRMKWSLWKNKFGLDSMTYYKFLFPGNGFFKQISPRADSITQFAPYVLDSGIHKPVHIVYLDNRPIFFRGTDALFRYSFRVGRGYHKIELRTADKLITIDSMFFAPYEKLLFSLDVNTDNPLTKVEQKPIVLTAQEQNRLLPYMTLVKENFSSKHAYLRQDEHFQLIRNSLGYRYNYLALVGPFSPRLMEFVKKDDFSTDFNFESRYNYEFSKGLLKMREQKEILRLKNHLNKSTQPLSFSDSVLTKAEIERMWKKMDDSKHITFEKYDNPKVTSFGRGQLHLKKIRSTDRQVPIVKNLLVVKPNDRYFMRIYPGKTERIHNLSEGMYKVVYLFKDEYYSAIDSIYVKPNGLNYYKFDPMS